MIVEDLKVITLEVGMLGTDCYLVQDGGTGDGYVIDPGGEARKVLDAVDGIGLKCLGILCTHGHMDHVGAVGKVAEGTGAPVYISEEDSRILAGTVQGLGARLGGLLVSKPRGVELLKGGDSLPMGEHAVRVLFTPGHTPGSLSFLIGGNLFCGDLVFQGSIGRTDLRGGSLESLMESVRREVFVLPPETRIFPGHGPATTVGAEKRYNPFLSRIIEEE